MHTYIRICIHAYMHTYDLCSTDYPPKFKDITRGDTGLAQLTTTN